MRSAFPGFGEITPPLPGGDAGAAPPPWPPGPDPRTPECRHDWDQNWGHEGERQHQCDYCHRWIWERSIWPEEGAPSGTV